MALHVRDDPVAAFDRRRAELRAGVDEAAADPGGVVAGRQARLAEVELQRDGLERARAVRIELDEEEQPEVVAQRRVDGVVVDEVAQVVEHRSCWDRKLNAGC